GDRGRHASPQREAHRGGASVTAPPLGPDARLVLDGVSAAYPGSTFDLAPVSFEAGRGQVVGIIGPHGGGQSTLLKAVAGVLPQRRGQVTLGGRPLSEHRGRLAFVPQREDVHWGFPASALDVVLMGRNRDIGWFRRPDREDRRIALDSLRRMG